MTTKVSIVCNAVTLAEVMKYVVEGKEAPPWIPTHILVAIAGGAELFGSIYCPRFGRTPSWFERWFLGRRQQRFFYLVTERAA